METNTFLLIFVILFIIINAYKFSVKNYDYWQKRKVLHPKPLPLFGNLLEVFIFRTHFARLLAKYYNQFQAPYFGLYAINKPCLVIRSPDLMKQILIKDFDFFDNRFNLADEELDCVGSKLLLLAKNPKWKLMRSKISPAFTSGKIKGMMPLITKAADDMKIYLKQSNTMAIDAKEVCAKYATDIVASCGFGIDAYCFKNEDAEFRAIGRKLFQFDLLTSIRHTCYFLLPNIAQLFRMSFLGNSVSKFMKKVILSAVERRRQFKQKRNDIIDIIIEIQNKHSADDLFNLDMDAVVAQAGQFFTAGFETVATTMSFALYELCLQPEVQNKLRSEIKDTFIKHGELHGEALQDLTYLDMVIFETLRKYPVLPFLSRECMKDYQLPNDDLVIEKGTPIFIPMLGLHYDAVYFEEPLRFNPERFSNENKCKLIGCSYLPFGAGPRNCIGKRLGISITKIGLAHLLSEYEIVKSNQTPIPLMYEEKGILLGSTVGLPVLFKRSLLFK